MVEVVGSKQDDRVVGVHARQHKVDKRLVGARCHHDAVRARVGDAGLGEARRQRGDQLWVADGGAVPERGARAADGGGRVAGGGRRRPVDDALGERRDVAPRARNQRFRRHDHGVVRGGRPARGRRHRRAARGEGAEGGGRRMEERRDEREEEMCRRWGLREAVDPNSDRNHSQLSTPRPCVTWMKRVLHSEGALKKKRRFLGKKQKQNTKPFSQRRHKRAPRPHTQRRLAVHVCVHTKTQRKKPPKQQQKKLHSFPFSFTETPPRAAPPARPAPARTSQTRSPPPAPP